MKKISVLGWKLKSCVCVCRKLKLCVSVFKKLLFCVWALKNILEFCVWVLKKLEFCVCILEKLELCVTQRTNHLFAHPKSWNCCTQKSGIVCCDLKKLELSVLVLKTEFLGSLKTEIMCLCMQRKLWSKTYPPLLHLACDSSTYCPVYFRCNAQHQLLRGAPRRWRSVNVQNLVTPKYKITPESISASSCITPE